MNINIQEAEWMSGRMNTKTPTSRHIIIKLLKDNDKEKSLKVVKKKWLIISKRSLIRLSSDFSSETLEAR